jgi:tetratricopeptide (TPR) repeat protein
MFDKRFEINAGWKRFGAHSPELGELIHQGEHFLAEAKLQPALDVFTRALTIFEGSPLKGSAAHQSILRAVADLTCATGNYSAAERYLFQYLARESASVESAKARFTLAQVSFSVGKFAQAGSLLESAIQIAREAVGREYDPTLLANSLWLQALTYRERCMIDEAAESCLEAIELFEEVYGPRSLRALMCRCTLDNLSILRGDLSDAAASLPKILKSLRAELDTNDLDLLTPLTANALLAIAIAKEMRRSRSLCEGRHEPHSTESVAESLRSFGLRRSAREIESRYGEWIPNKDVKSYATRLERELIERSKALLKEALMISEDNLGPFHPSNAELLDKLSIVCAALHQDQESAGYESQAAHLREQNRTRTEL